MPLDGEGMNSRSLHKAEISFPSGIKCQSQASKMVVSRRSPLINNSRRFARCLDLSPRDPPIRLKVCSCP
jgi:hypothetical protein